MLQKFNYVYSLIQYALIVLQISKQSNKAHASYNDFKKYYEKEEAGEERYEENKANFGGAYHGLTDSAQIPNWVYPMQ